jgi:pimeloyl-ACP methyl ester carboxylesterase
MNKFARLFVVVAALLLFTGCVTAPKSQSLGEGKSDFALLGTNKIHYVTVGQGSNTLVLVHCWSGNLRFWREQVPALSDKARLVLIDLPGHGLSDKPRRTYTMDFFADAVLAVMQDAHVKKATLVGHSMGVAVVCTVYKRAPGKVTGLVTVDNFLKRPKMSPTQADGFIAQFRGPDYREKTRAFLTPMFPGPDPAVRDRVIEEMLRTPQHVIVGAAEGMFGPGQPDWDPGRLTVPLLVLNAPNERWTADYQAQLRSFSANVEYRTIPGTGHWLMLEKPAEFNAALVEMLRKHGLVAK